MEAWKEAASAAMDRYACGQDAAFSDLYDLLAPRLSAFIGRRTRDRALAEDLVQQTFLQMHTARSHFCSGADVTPWAFAIARRLLIDTIRNDAEWNGGNYTKQPRSLQLAQVSFGIATAGGTQGLYKIAPPRAQADEEIDRRLAQPSAADANDVIYQFESSRDYNPSPKLEAIQAHLLAVNSADDERNPPELGIMDREIKRELQAAQSRHR